SDPWPSTKGEPTGAGLVLASSFPFTTSGFGSEPEASTSAAAPLVMAALKEVPEPTKLALPTRAEGYLVSMVDPGVRRLTTERPEVARSGLNQPSTMVGPTLEKSDTLSSAGEAVPWSSRAPTVMTRGSSPGLMIVPLKGPALPAETTTTTPARQAASTAWSRGLSTVEVVGMVPRDRLSTLMPSRARLATTQSMPAMTVAMSVTPLAPATLTDTRRAPGASPSYSPPEEAPLPAMRPDT